jgi:hypothetical protein
MKAAPFLLLILGAAAVSACDDYDYCYCVDDNGNAIDSDTTSVCNAQGGSLAGYTGTTCTDYCCPVLYQICNSPDNPGYWDNCGFSGWCQGAGASESQCVGRVYSCPGC